MSWFRSAFESISSTLKAVGRVVKGAWENAKEIAGKAVGWMAEKAEGFVGTVKSIWTTVKPYVEKFQCFLKVAAQHAPWPWLKIAILALDGTLTALTKFENSPIAKKIDQAIKWSIELAKRWQERKSEKHSQESTDDISNEELSTAKKHQETFRAVERELGNHPDRKNVALASAINDYNIARKDISNALNNPPVDFEHYLRIRAAQKLLALAEKKFIEARTLEDLSLDDLFIVQNSSNLVKDSPELSAEAAVRLDRIIYEKFGRKLTPFVFEELVASWAMRSKELHESWTVINTSYAKDLGAMKRLSLSREIQGELSVAESEALATLEKLLPIRKQELDAIAEKAADVDRYVGAVEGFLQLLEKSPEEIDEIEKEGSGYLITEGAEVGKVLIRCAERDLAFRELTAEEQELVIDYSNIFQSEAKDRMNRVLEVEV